VKINREDVIQAALMIERWCAEEFSKGDCRMNCPLGSGNPCSLCLLFYDDRPPKEWNLAERLRKRGLKHDD
jgi:hypothetical protein